MTGQGWGSNVASVGPTLKGSRAARGAGRALCCSRIPVQCLSLPTALALRVRPGTSTIRSLCLRSFLGIRTPVSTPELFPPMLPSWSSSLGQALPSVRLCPHLPFLPSKGPSLSCLAKTLPGLPLWQSEPRGDCRGHYSGEGDTVGRRSRAPPIRLGQQEPTGVRQPWLPATGVPNHLLPGHRYLISCPEASPHSSMEGNNPEGRGTTQRNAGWRSPQPVVQVGLAGKEGPR